MRKPTFGHTKHGHPVHAHTNHHIGQAISFKYWWLHLHESFKAIDGINARVALTITAVVGTMWCAYIFCLIAFVSLPAALTAFKHGDMTVAISWLSQSFIQLVLLPVIIVGQNLQNIASDARSAKTLEDIEVVKDWLSYETEGGVNQLLEAIDQRSKQRDG